MLTRRQCLLGSVGSGIVALGGGCATTPAAEPVRDSLRQMVGAREGVAGAVAVLVDGDRERMVARGTSGVPNVALDANTVFEIGSITKVMCALLLAEMAEGGEVGLDDPLARYLPSTVTLHERARSITLRDLAGYNSGLPKLPGNLPANWYINPNPFAAYGTDRLNEAISAYIPAPGQERPFVYSSFAFGILGMALARRAGKSFEELLVERICEPLGLSHTRITLSADMRKHLVQPHDVTLKSTPLWDFQPALQGAGAARASVADATTFLKACMGVTRTSLQPAFSKLLETRRPTPLAGTQAALGWFISTSGDDEIVWKTGVTGGCNTFAGFSTRRRRGAFILLNFLWEPLDIGTTAKALKMINPAFDAGDLSALYR